MSKTLTGSIESIDQMIVFIEGLSDTEYQFFAKPWFEGSIGQHLRHVIDLYLALINRAHADLINYDIRRRGHAVETVREIGLEELTSVRQWISEITIDEIEQQTTVSTEVTMSSQQTDVFVSSLNRELCFVSHHLTHHLALMAVIAKMTGKEVDPTLGLAAATATYIREQ